MNGQLTEQPLAELIREISAKRLSGRLRVQQNRVTVVIYFKDGECLYAAANVRTLRLREYLTKLNLLTEQDLQAVDANKSDLELAAILVDNNLIQAKTVHDVQLKQIADVVRLALLWVDGTWEFDLRSQLNEKVDFDFDPASLFLDAARRLPPSYIASRLPNDGEMLSLNESASVATQVEPKEGFVLSRLDRAMPLKQLITLTGLPDSEALKIVYGLALSDHIVRENWKEAFSDIAQTPSRPRTPEPPISEPEDAKEVDEKDLAVFVDRVESATTFYDVLSLTNNAMASDLKQAYYDLARRYHPDRFRRRDLGPMRGRLESAFARITQAYETLGDQTSRANYDSRLEARARSRSTPEPAQPSSAAPTSDTTTDELSIKNKAEESFKAGRAALKSGETKKAVAHFGFAAQACPNEARYHAFYGQALSTFDNSRRQAEVELQAALKIEPNNPDYRTMLAQLYRALGFPKRARAEAERALASAPQHEGAKGLLRDLP